ncbi:MAG: hypothetical protein GY855_00920, partial [candidate division Zixibacteria bacterium]|nr:hypothetical protein [candidate division Zixibacteria bacterium]
MGDKIVKKLREDALCIFTSCLKAINPERLLKSFLSIENDSLRIRGEEYYLPRYNNI